MAFSGLSILVTGVAGFIGSHFAKEWLNNNGSVIGIDNINNYYDPTIKHKRIASLSVKNPDRFKFYQININDKIALINMFNESIIKPRVSIIAVIHLAAQVN
jgi:UDP-glucuronate 4-epimerase